MDPDPESIQTLVSFNLSAFLAEQGWYFLLIALLLFLSGLTSATEVAFFSLTQAELKTLREANDRVWEVVRKPKKLLATILIFNNLVNVAMVLISSLLLKDVYDTYSLKDTPWAIWVFPILEVGVVTFVLLFFGEITPKIYASQNRQSITRWMAMPALFMRTLLSPFSFLLLKSTSFLDSRVSLDSSSASFEDIKHAIDLTSEEESPEEEKGILKGIVNLSNTGVRAIMRARVDIAALDFGLSLQEVVERINHEGYSRMPVFSGNLDKIKGILYVKDLLPLLRSEPAQIEWQSLIRPAYFVPENKRTYDLLQDFKEKRLHIAIVVDEFGGTSGLVTFEDIIEEIFGEIVDEFDEEELVFSKLSDSEYVFDGKTPLNDLIRATDLPDNVFEEMKGSADSLAGLVLELHGKFPEKGETIQHERFKFHVESVSQNRIKRVKVEILPDLTQDGTSSE